jgi:agmatinase
MSECAAALEKETCLPLTCRQHELAQVQRHGLNPAASIVDRRIFSFSRGEWPQFVGINT